MLTPHGELLLRNFLDLSAKPPPSPVAPMIPSAGAEK
jgi:hypothetical protein